MNIKFLKIASTTVVFLCVPLSNTIGGGLCFGYIPGTRSCTSFSVQSPCSGRSCDDQRVTYVAESVPEAKLSSCNGVYGVNS